MKKEIVALSVKIPAKRIEIKVDINSELHSATLPITWCISKRMEVHLEKIDNLDPFMLIAIIPEKGVNDNSYNRLEQRHIVKLSEMIKYISFVAPGRNLILLLELPKMTLANLQNKLLTKNSRGYYQFSIFAQEYVAKDFKLKDNELNFHHADKITNIGEYRREYEEHSFFLKAIDEIIVNIPQGLFAEYSDKERKWVNYFWGNKNPSDECKFRQRKFFAYSVQPVLIGFKILLSAIGRSILVLVMLFFGMSGSLDALKSFNYIKWNDGFWNFIDVFRYRVEQSLIIKNHKIPRLAIPLVLLVSLFVVGAFILGFDNIVVRVILRVMITFLFVVILMLGVSILVNYFGDRIKLFKAKRKDSAKAKQEQENEQLKIMQRSELKILSCDGFKDKPAGLEAVPEAKRTLELRFSAFKAKVCRPFAG